MDPLIGEGLRQEIESQPTTTQTVSTFAGMSVDDLVSYLDSQAKPVILNIALASAEERTILQQAQATRPEKLQLLDFDQTATLREITDAVRNSEVLIGVFAKFQRDLLKYSPQLEVAEWIKFIAGHEVAGSATSPEKTHHWDNLGVSPEEEGVKQEIISVLQGVRTRLSAEFQEFFDTQPLSQHATAVMNEDPYRSVTLALANLSNFVRGIYQGISMTSSDFSKVYKPRQLAYGAIKEYDRTTRGGHIRWAKDRALALVDSGDCGQAVISMLSDLTKHPETVGLIEEFRLLAFSALLSKGYQETAVRSFIEGFTE